MLFTSSGCLISAFIFSFQMCDKNILMPLILLSLCFFIQPELVARIYLRLQIYLSFAATRKSVLALCCFECDTPLCVVSDVAIETENASLMLASIQCHHEAFASFTTSGNRYRRGASLFSSVSGAAEADAAYNRSVGDKLQLCDILRAVCCLCRGAVDAR